MSEIFENLLDHSLALQKNNKENQTTTKAININEDDDKHTSPNTKKQGPKCEFNHQHLIAEGAAKLLFRTSINPQGSMNNPVINSAAYSMESAVREIFRRQLRLDSINAIKDGTAVEVLQEHVLRAISLKRANQS